MVTCIPDVFHVRLALLGPQRALCQEICSWWPKGKHCRWTKYCGCAFTDFFAVRTPKPRPQTPNPFLKPFKVSGQFNVYGISFEIACIKQVSIARVIDFRVTLCPVFNESTIPAFPTMVSFLSVLSLHRVYLYANQCFPLLVSRC